MKPVGKNGYAGGLGGVSTITPDFASASPSTDIASWRSDAVGDNHSPPLSSVSESSLPHPNPAPSPAPNGDLVDLLLTPLCNASASGVCDSDKSTLACPFLIANVLGPDEELDPAFLFNSSEKCSGGQNLE